MKLIASNRAAEQIKANMFMLGIISLVTIVMWIGISVYFSYTKTSVKSDMKQLIKPINPSLDNDALVEFQNSRISPPETFQIIAKSGEGNKSTTVMLDPFSTTIASDSANTNE